MERQWIIIPSEKAEACASHDAYSELERIHCPTLVIGAAQDRIVGTQAAGELAKRIPGSRIIIYEGYGHGVYEEAGDWLPRVEEFLLQRTEGGSIL